MSSIAERLEQINEQIKQAFDKRRQVDCYFESF